MGYCRFFNQLKVLYGNIDEGRSLMCSFISLENITRELSPFIFSFFFPASPSGVPWTEEEHKTFLAGLRTLGKGDWRGISRNFVKSRTPAQVASHAQKYFLRQTTPSTKKRRSSLFDVVMNDTVILTLPLPLPFSASNISSVHGTRSFHTLLNMEFAG